MGHDLQQDNVGSSVTSCPLVCKVFTFLALLECGKVNPRQIYEVVFSKCQLLIPFFPLLWAQRGVHE